jgi:carboxymethylenebutenolidase
MLSLPGIPPTGRKLEIPFTAVVNIRGDRLYHEHIAWDQATVLIQLGLMPRSLPYPLAIPGRQAPAPSAMLEFRVPAAGVEAAAKLRDKEFCRSNEMFEFEIRETLKS